MIDRLLNWNIQFALLMLAVVVAIYLFTKWADRQSRQHPPLASTPTNWVDVAARMWITGQVVKVTLWMAVAVAALIWFVAH